MKIKVTQKENMRYNVQTLRFLPDRVGSVKTYNDVDVHVKDDLTFGAVPADNEFVINRYLGLQEATYGSAISKVKHAALRLRA